jgi:phosphatidylinositol alpha-1,6-mannosyltransferase
MPFVVYAHGNEVLNATQIDGHKLKVSLRMADRVLAVSRYTADLVQKIGVSPERIEIVNPGCDTKRFRPLHPRMDLKEKFVDGRYGDKLIVSVGNLVPRKGHDMVIRALCQLREIVPNFTYVIAGEGPYRVELEKLALDLGVRERVVFAGRISGEDLPDIYAISDVFVMPSREQINENDVEGFGIVFLEASACAKPVVGGHSGGIPDAIEDGVTGLLVNANDPKDIGAALARLLNDRDLAVRMGQQGRAWVNKNFTWTTTAKKVAGILQQVLQEKSTRSVPGALSLPVKSIVEDAHQGAPNSK